MSIENLPDWVKPGASFKYDYGPDNHNNGRKFHVRAIVDGLAVLREWSAVKRRWRYKVEGPEYFHAFSEAIAFVKQAPMRKPIEATGMSDGGDKSPGDTSKPNCQHVHDHVVCACRGSAFNVYRCRNCGDEEWL